MPYDGDMRFNEDMVVPCLPPYGVPTPWKLSHGEYPEEVMKPVCFVCGLEFDLEYPMVFMYRTWRFHGEVREIHHPPLLQSCLPCSGVCAQHTVKWRHEPKLIPVEHRAFRWYGQCIDREHSLWLGDTAVEFENSFYEMRLNGSFHHLLVDEDDLVGGKYRRRAVEIGSAVHCSGCHQAFAPGQRYLEFTITIESWRNEPEVGASLSFAQYCETCFNGHVSKRGVESWY